MYRVIIEYWQRSEKLLNHQMYQTKFSIEIFPEIKTW